MGERKRKKKEDRRARSRDKEKERLRSRKQQREKGKLKEIGMQPALGEWVHTKSVLFPIGVLFRKPPLAKKYPGC